MYHMIPWYQEEKSFSTYNQCVAACYSVPRNFFLNFICVVIKLSVNIAHTWPIILKIHERFFSLLFIFALFFSREKYISNVVKNKTELVGWCVCLEASVTCNINRT